MYYELIPYRVLCDIFEGYYNCVVTTNEFNWVQQGKINVTSNESIDLNKINNLIQKSRYTDVLKLVKETKKSDSIRYQYRR